jgi:anthraniloyl-CoA monooxygenase
LRFQQRITDLSAFSDADIIGAADGSNSHVRSLYADGFWPSIEQRQNKFAWYGTHQLFHPVSLIFRETNYGIFIAHCYQYSRELSTFLVEVDPETWKRAGLDRKSEEESRYFCGEVFRPELGSNELLANRSLWLQANIVRNENWTHKNIVLLGDACRTVHFSLGSGTRMAMQDAITLHQGLLRHGSDVAAAFKHYEEIRRPATSNFQSAADKSLDWYENVARKMHLDPVTFAYDYMRRTGRVSHEALRERDPRFIAAYEATTEVAA